VIITIINFIIFLAFEGDAKNRQCSSLGQCQYLDLGGQDQGQCRKNIDLDASRQMLGLEEYITGILAFFK